MTEHIRYVTLEGERWDTVAQKVYGDPHLYRPIIAANPTVPIRPVIEGGTVLYVPVRDVRPELAAAAEPPWRRGGDA